MPRYPIDSLIIVYMDIERSNIEYVNMISLKNRSVLRGDFLNPLRSLTPKSSDAKKSRKGGFFLIMQTSNLMSLQNRTSWFGFFWTRRGIWFGRVEIVIEPYSWVFVVGAISKTTFETILCNLLPVMSRPLSNLIAKVFEHRDSSLHKFNTHL